MIDAFSYVQNQQYGYQILAGNTSVNKVFWTLCCAISGLSMRHPYWAWDMVG